MEGEKGCYGAVMSLERIIRGGWRDKEIFVFSYAGERGVKKDRFILKKVLEKLG